MWRKALGIAAEAEAGSAEGRSGAGSAAAAARAAAETSAGADTYSLQGCVRAGVSHMRHGAFTGCGKGHLPGPR